MIIANEISQHFYASTGKVEALHQVSLTVEKGDIFGIIGKSGAGKSTLMRCLSSLEKPVAGKIFIENQNIVTLPAAELRSFRQKIGMVFQQFNLLSSRTVAENISYPLEIHGMDKQQRRERIQEMLTLVGLEQKRDVYPAHLSGGQKQRVGIARALASHPSVLFCDEATSALDPKTTRDLLNLLKKIHSELGLTIVLITHEIAVIKQVCNRMAVLDQGRLVEKGTIAEVFADPKHETTRQLLQNSIHEVPLSFFKADSSLRKLLRLTFTGEKAGEPIISKMIKKFDVEVNILLGWIDSLQGVTIGNLVIELFAPEPKSKEALQFLKNSGVHCEELRR